MSSIPTRTCPRSCPSASPGNAASYGLDVEDVGRVLRFALAGKVATELIPEDRSINDLLRLDRLDVGAPGDLESLILFSKA
jgi:Cu/Ag efflux pump CusA